MRQRRLYAISARERERRVMTAFSHTLKEMQLPKAKRQKEMIRKNGRRIFVDMDGTLCRFTYVSRRMLYSKGYFASLAPDKDVVDAVKRLHREGERVCILSCYLKDSIFARKEKERWLKRNIPGIPYILIPCGSSKAEAAEKMSGRRLCSADVLLDDFTDNLNEWKEKGGTALKLLNGINDTKGCWKGERIRNCFCYEDIKKHISV